MGGVFGKLHFNRLADQDFHTLLARMSDVLVHRGPDTAATYVGIGVGLGERGFLTEHSSSAVVAATEDRAIHVVADADVTNAPALRRRLSALGHHFQGFTDAEVIAHAYEQWGEDAFADLHGAFACAVWDERTGQMVLARDRFGMKPLCFALQQGQGLVFASEIKGVLADPSVGRMWSPEAIDTYLAVGYVPSPLTIYRDVSKLEPGTLLAVEGRRMRVRQYWDAAFAPAPSRTAADTVEALRHVLRSAVSAAADEDGAGLLQSGGAASTALLAGLPERASLPALSVAVEGEPRLLVRAAEAARHAGASADVDIVAPDAAAAAAQMTWALDEPCGDPAAVAQFVVFGAAAGHMRLAVAGHGAAALWAGYPRHHVEAVESTLRKWLGAPLAAAGGRLAGALPASLRGARTLSHLALTPADACVTKHAYGLFDGQNRRSVYTRGFAWKVRDANPFARHLELYAACPSPDPLARALYVETHTFLADNALAIADRAAAAAALRLRLPYLDDEAASLALTAPTCLKQHGAEGMHALRRLLGATLPSRLRPPAHAQPPARPWLDDALRTMVPRMLFGYRFDQRGIFSRSAIARLWDEHQTGRGHHHERLWSLLMLEVWFRKFIDGEGAEGPLEYAVLRAA